MSLLVIIFMAVATEKTFSKKEVETISRGEACRVLCIKQGYQTGDYLAKKKSCRCSDIKEYHQFYNRTMSLGYTLPNEDEKFKNEDPYWYE